MAENKNRVIFEAVMKYLKNGEYVVVSRKELETSLPEEITKEDYESAINSFQVNGLITVRYSDEEVYCLIAKEKAIIGYENILEEKEKHRKELANNTINNSTTNNNTTNNYVTNNKTVKETTEKTEVVINEEFEKRIENNNKRYVIISVLVSFAAAFFGALIPCLVILSKLR